MKEKPELAELILPKTQELGQTFDDLERTTKEKGERLFDANREVSWLKYALHFTAYLIYLFVCLGSAAPDLWRYWFMDEWPGETDWSWWYW